MQMTPASQPSIVPSKLLNSISTQRSQAFRSTTEQTTYTGKPIQDSGVCFPLEEQGGKERTEAKVEQCAT